MSRDIPPIKHVQELRSAFHSVMRGYALLQAGKPSGGKGLSFSQAHALIELLKRQLYNQGELSNTLGLSKSATSRMVAALEERGWVEREPDPGDGRARHLRLTGRGRRVALEVDQASLSRFERVLLAVPKTSRRSVTAALELIGRAMETDAASTSMPELLNE